MAEPRQTANIQLTSQCIDYITWQNKKVETRAESRIEDHSCPLCHNTMHFRNLDALKFRERVGWVHLKCVDLGHGAVFAQKRDVGSGSRESYQNRMYFRKSLRKALAEQRALWEPPRGKVWAEGQGWRAGSLWDGGEVLGREEMRAKHGSIPISIASSMINSVVGHEIISRPGFESLVRHGVYTLYRLRALTDAKWKRLLFSEKERDLIRDCIKAETTPALALQTAVRHNLPDARILSLNANARGLTDSEIARGTKMAPLLQREIDRENVFSPAVRFFQKTSFFARPHADVVVRDAELFKTESVLERFPINYDSDDGLERRAEGARNMSEFVKQFDEEDDEMGQERRAGGKGDADKYAALDNMSDEKKIAAGNSYFGFDKLDRVRDLFEKKYGDLVNRPVLDEIHEQLELCKSQAEVKALIDRVSDKAFLDKLIKKNPFAYKDETNKEFDHNLEYNLEENNFENLTDIKGNFPEEYENLTENTDNFDDIKDNFHENIEKSTKITKNLAKTDQNLAEDDTNISENNPKFEKTNENNSKNAEKQLIAAKTRIINNLLAKGYPRELAEKVQVEQNIESVPMNELIPRDENVLYLDSPSEAHPALDPHNITEADFETFLKQNDQVVENDPQKSVDFSEIADFAKITQEKFGKTQKLDEFLVSATDSSEAECEGRDEDRFEEYMSRREIFMRKWLSDRRQESMDEKEKKIEIDIKTSENAEISLEAPEITEIALKTRESAEIDSNPIPKAYEIKLDETHQNIRETFQKDLPRLKRLLGNETVFISTTMDYPLTPENSAYIEILKSREKPLLSHLDGLADLEEMRAAMSTNRFKELDEMQRHVENDDPVSMREAYEKLTIGGADGDNENARLIDSLRDKAIDAEEEIGGEVVAQVREFEMEDGCTDFDDTEANKESWDEDTLDEDKEKEPDDEKLVAFGESSEDDRRRERAAEEKENQKDGDLDDEEGEFTDLLEEAGRKMGL